MTGEVWTLGAEADVQAIYERLETWEEGTGDRFYAEVLTCVDLLTVFPQIGPVVHRKARSVACSFSTATTACITSLRSTASSSTRCSTCGKARKESRRDWRASDRGVN